MTKENKVFKFLSKMVLTFAVVAAMAGAFSIKCFAEEYEIDFKRITFSDIEPYDNFDTFFMGMGDFVEVSPSLLNSSVNRPLVNDDYSYIICRYDGDTEFESGYDPWEGDFAELSRYDFEGSIYPWIRDNEYPYYYVTGYRVVSRIDCWTGLKTDISLAAEAAKSGTPQTVDYKGTGALPESVINMLLANPLVTLNYECVDAQGNSTFLVLNADILAFAEANVHWFGPKYIQRMMDLYSYSQYVTARLGAGAVYTVQEGDTYESIASKFGLPLEGFMGLNALNSANGLRVGQKVLVKFI